MEKRQRANVAALGLALLVSTPAGAEIPADWQAAREASNALSARACEGDEAAFRALNERARLGEAHPDKAAATARISLAWLSINENCGRYVTGDHVTATGYYMQAAEAGYPLAIGILGLRMILGLGMPVQKEAGLTMAAAGLELGYGDIGAFIAQEYITGANLERSEAKARDWLARAAAAGTRQTLIDETAAMLDAEFGAPVRDAPAVGAWLPPLSGDGFHAVGGLCVMRSDGVTIATSAGQADSRPTLIGISNDGWNFEGEIGQERSGASLTVQVRRAFESDSFLFAGTPRAGDADTLVLHLSPAEIAPLWERFENRCMYDPDGREAGSYMLGAGWANFDPGEFYQPWTWSRFKSCSGVYFLSSFGECQ